MKELRLFKKKKCGCLETPIQFAPCKEHFIKLVIAKERIDSIKRNSFTGEQQ